MKKNFVAVIILILLMGMVDNGFGQGKFSVTLTNNNNVLMFKLKPNITITTGFSTIEFFLRYPDSSPDFTYSAVTVNSVNFPGMTSSASKTKGSGAWEIERNNPLYLVTGYKVDHFIYTAPAPISTVRNYTAGTEYDLISVAVIGDPNKTVDFKLIHQNTEKSAYLAITGELGNDLRPASLNNYFYPLTSTITGPENSVYYFMDRTQVPLPLKLLSFKAISSSCSVDLIWKTSYEVNTAYHAIERSTNNIDFTEIGRLVPGNASIAISYNFTDTKAGDGTRFYRIRFVDVNGEFSYSNSIDVKSVCRQRSAVQVYPTVTKGIVNILMPVGYESAGITIINAEGKKMLADVTSGLNRTISIKNFASGPYFLQITNNRTTENVKVILQK